MLDIAMIDYSRATNKLSDYARCLLCLKKAKLCRSHVFPRNILERFCSSMSRPEKTKQNITPMRPGPLQSPKGVTTFLFCLSCESMLSRHGEEHFTAKFLDTIYNISVPESPKAAHHINYGKWLYHFCIGLIFRGLIQAFPHGFSNEEDIYELFVQCRSCLLLSDTHATIEQGKCPPVALLINPTTQPPETPKSGFINFALNYPWAESSSSLPLDGMASKGPDRIFYFNVHFGIINVIAIVDPSQKGLLTDNCFIQPEGGVFNVLEDEKRYQTMPKGLWSYFEHTAMELETEHLRMSMSRLKWQEDNVLTEPKEEVVNMFGIVPSFGKDVKSLGNVLHPASVVNIEKNLNFLPEGFQLHHKEEHNSVIVPNGHKLIFHHTSTDGSGRGSTVFLAVGNEGAYSLDTPYVIYHNYQPGLQMHAAFFVNMNTFQPEDYLPERDPKLRIGDIRAFFQFRQDIPKLLPQILLQKGVYSIKSLLRRIQMRYVLTY